MGRRVARAPRKKRLPYHPAVWQGGVGDETVTDVAPARTTGSVAAPLLEPPGRVYPWVVVAFLTTIYTVAFIDRQVLNLLVDPIKRTLILTDTQVSLLQGLAFTSAYVIFSPVFGRLSDRRNRRNILIGGTATWSLFTIACGFSSDFWMLFISRFGVGAAEACVAPAAWSMLADYFDRERLPRAMSVFLIGPYLGAGLALVFGGLLIRSAAELAALHVLLTGFEPWQLVFIAIGAPGLLLAVATFAVREPPRLSGTDGGEASRTFTVKEVALFFWEGRAFFGRFYFAMAAIIIVLYALPAWMPAVLIRQHGADPATVGLEYGSLVLIMGTLGVLSGPLVGRWLERRRHSGSTVLVAGIAGLALVPASAAIALVQTYEAGLAAAAVATFFFSLPQAMAASALQLATPNGMRGIAASMYVFLVAVIGLGISPTIVALLTDYVFGDPARVGTSLGIVCASSAVVGAWLAFQALPHYRAALKRLER
jgi:MFS transporter, Spinster family, sphingosine-1-phosphate transporter